VLIVVDARCVDGLQLGALADYIAMLGLAKINIDANFSSDDSVLRLFQTQQNAQTVKQLSAWDAAFLKALYHTAQNYKMQRSVIIDSMMHELSP
jgi:hypothetical protein